MTTDSTPMGFSGLSCLVSDIDAVLNSCTCTTGTASAGASTCAATARQSQNTAASAAATAQNPEANRQTRLQSLPELAPKKQRNPSQFGCLFLIVLLIVLLMNATFTKHDRRPQTNYASSLNERAAATDDRRPQRNYEPSPNERLEQHQLPRFGNQAARYRIDGKNPPSGAGLAKARRDIQQARGDTQSIRQAQLLLQGLGYHPGAADGKYGPKTKAAIIAFQKAYGYVDDGRVTDGLINALRMANNNKAFSQYLIERQRNLSH